MYICVSVCIPPANIFRLVALSTGLFYLITFCGSNAFFSQAPTNVINCVLLLLFFGIISMHAPFYKEIGEKNPNHYSKYTAESWPLEGAFCFLGGCGVLEKNIYSGCLADVERTVSW